MTYRLPPQDIVDIVDSPPTPIAVLSPDRGRLVLVDYDANPPVALLARPFLRLAGVRVDPPRTCRQRVNRLTALTIVRTADGTRVPLDVPSTGVGIPVWSRDGSRFAFSVDLEDGVELWIADAGVGGARRVPGLRVNDVLGGGRGGALMGAPAAPVVWSRDGHSLLVKAVPPDRGPVPAGERGPRIEECEGKRTQMATFQDLLSNDVDEDLFAYHAASQLVRLDAETLVATPVGAPGLVAAVRPSPDERWLLVQRIIRPFSYRVPYTMFPRSVEVWTPAGEPAATVAQLPLHDEVPRQGVPTGPRGHAWQPKRDAAVLWLEALDGGDPKQPAEHRDRMMRLEAPFDARAAELLRTKQRLVGMDWAEQADRMIVHERDWDRRWWTARLVDLSSPAGARVLFDQNESDVYADPGAPVYAPDADGDRTMVQDGDWIYMSGRGASPSGARPFLDRLNLSTGDTERLWQCDEGSFEMFAGFVGDGQRSILTSYQAPAEPQNLFVVDVAAGGRRALTDWPDPHPELTGSTKRLIRYTRDDGVELSGTLHLPPGYAGERVPVLVWAYPMDYSDPATAGQVRGTDKAFTRLQGVSPLWLLLRGWAVLMDATMPVVGDPETKNDTFVDEVVASAKAAIDALDEMGVVDRSRVVASGHSYGGFMTATLLAHTDLFAAGIARSGAYNRTLTPFGFQTERRSYWEAPEVYHRVSPFRYADRITAPILLIHGEEDNNSGTFPIQSERLFQAIRGHGGTARYVTLPHESHGYRGRESILHVIAETFDWAERWAGASLERSSSAESVPVAGG